MWNGVVQEEVLVPGRSTTLASRARELAMVRTLHVHGSKGRMRLWVARLVDGDRGRRAPEGPRRVTPDRYWRWWEVQRVVVPGTS